MERRRRRRRQRNALPPRVAPVRRKRSLPRWSAYGTSAGGGFAPSGGKRFSGGSAGGGAGATVEEAGRRPAAAGAPVHRRSYRFTYLCSSGRTVSATQTSPFGVIVM